MKPGRPGLMWALAGGDPSFIRYIQKRFSLSFLCQSHSLFLTLSHQGDAKNRTRASGIPNTGLSAAGQE